MEGTTGALRVAYSSTEFWSGLAALGVVAGIAAELGILFAFSHGMSRLEKWLLVAANVIVISGCGGEWWFGGKAANIAGELQRRSDVEVATLRDKANASELAVAKLKTPRTLGPDRQKAVFEAVFPYKGQRYEASISPGADDGPAFWESLYAALALGNALHADGTVVVVSRDSKSNPIEADRDILVIVIGARVPPPQSPHRTGRRSLFIPPHSQR